MTPLRPRALACAAAAALLLGACAPQLRRPPSSTLDGAVDPAETAPVLVAGAPEGSAAQAPAAPAASPPAGFVEPSSAPAVAATPPLPIPEDANFILSVADSIASSEEDAVSQTKVFVDGKAAGETHVGPRSQEKRWGLRLEPGNRLFRFEHWALTPPAAWGPLDAAWQPRERFIRIEEGSRAVLTLRFSEGGRRHSVQFSRERR